MRYCWICKEAMYGSIENIWIDRKNYDIHKKCKEKYLANDINDGGKER